MRARVSLVAAALCLVSTLAQADARVGLGQPTAADPPQLGLLRLDHPLVSEKYAKDPDLMRFLRGTYAEACTRGMLAKATRQMRTDPKYNKGPDAARFTALFQDGKRIWRMGSLELESVFKESYLQVANYCDCLVLEVSDRDLANPQKGIEVIEGLPESRRKMCETVAEDQTKQQLRKYLAPQPKPKTP